MDLGDFFEQFLFAFNDSTIHLSRATDFAVIYPS